MKADTSANEVSSKTSNKGLDSLLDEVGNVPSDNTTDSLTSEIDAMVDLAADEEKVAAAVAVERRCHMKIAKLLASLDVISEVRS